MYFKKRNNAVLGGLEMCSTCRTVENEAKICKIIAFRKIVCKYCEKNGQKWVEKVVIFS